MTSVAWAPALQPALQPAFSVTMASTVEPEAPEADDVVAGWSGFLVIALLGVATVFLIRSMRKQLKRIDFDDGSEPDREADDDPPRG